MDKYRYFTINLYKNNKLIDICGIIKTNKSNKVIKKDEKELNKYEKLNLGTNMYYKYIEQPIYILK